MHFPQPRIPDPAGIRAPAFRRLALASLALAVAGSASAADAAQAPYRDEAAARAVISRGLAPVQKTPYFAAASRTSIFADGLWASRVVGGGYGGESCMSRWTLPEPSAAASFTAASSSQVCRESFSARAATAAAGASGILPESPEGGVSQPQAEDPEPVVLAAAKAGPAAPDRPAASGVATVPEPSSATSLLVGLIGVIGVIVLKRRSRFE